MLRFFLVLALALVGSAAATERSSVISDGNLEINIPANDQRKQVSQVAPDIFDSLSSPLNQGKARVIEILMTSDDIEHARNDESFRSFSIFIARHPISGDEALSEEDWNQFRPIYRKLFENTQSPEMESMIQEEVDSTINVELQDRDKLQFKRFDQPEFYREDSASMRLFTLAHIQRGSENEGILDVVRAFNATIFVKNRLFLIQANKLVENADSEAEFNKGRAEFDHFVDQLIKMNP